jgi:hypothetical protein
MSPLTVALGRDGTWLSDRPAAPEPTEGRKSHCPTHPSKAAASNSRAARSRRARKHRVQESGQGGDRRDETSFEALVPVAMKSMQLTTFMSFLSGKGGRR